MYYSISFHVIIIILHKLFIFKLLLIILYFLNLSANSMLQTNAAILILFCFRLFVDLVFLLFYLFRVLLEFKILQHL
jgi:hypothetical protein